MALLTALRENTCYQALIFEQNQKGKPLTEKEITDIMKTKNFDLWTDQTDVEEEIQKMLDEEEE